MVNAIQWSGQRAIVLALICVAMISGCAGRTKQRITAVPELRPGLLIGYLQPESLPNSLSLLPSPPAAGSVAFALDQERSKKSAALRDTVAWTLAASDADLTFPHAAGTFSCALNAPITEHDTPRLYILLRRTLTDAGRATYAAKKAYDRARPFELNNHPICTPDEKSMLEQDGSYPSGHGAIGMAWSLLLAEIAPQQSDAILARGRAFASSRIVCNVHWQSDALQGRFIGTYTIARLHADPTFRSDLDAARAELEAIRAKGAKATRDCSAETAAIALQRSLTLQ